MQPNAGTDMFINPKHLQGADVLARFRINETMYKADSIDEMGQLHAIIFHEFTHSAALMNDQKGTC